jgi:hypothetical protein
MRMHFFGDSYDIVKRFLLDTLGDGSPWIAYPMLTHEVTEADVAAFERFLGAAVASDLVFAPGCDRSAGLCITPGAQHVFLDPDTGVRLKPSGGAKSSAYVFGPELQELCLSEPDRLALVFDQSLPRGEERSALEAKLAYFAERDVFGFAYLSHACFLILSANQDVITQARRALLATGLPGSRLVRAE